MNRVGGYQTTKVTDAITKLANQLGPVICEKLKIYSEIWVVNRAWSQVVAGTNYHLFLETDQGQYVTAQIFRPLQHQNKVPELKQVFYDHVSLQEVERPRQILFGGYSRKGVNDEDRQLIRNLRRHINHHIQHHTPEWIINAVESQVVSGENKLYRLKSSKGVFATVIVYIPLPSHHQYPRVTFGQQGHLSASDISNKQITILGGRTYQSVSVTTRKLVSRHFDRICKQSQIDAGSWTVNQVQSQVVNGVNYYIRITSDSGVVCQAEFHQNHNTSGEDSQLVGVTI